MPRQAVTLGGVWWWAQNWAQSPGFSFGRHNLADHRWPICEASSCPALREGYGGGMSGRSAYFFLEVFRVVVAKLG
jgi:hypothetical protein